MAKESLDESVEKLLKEENPQAEAVKHLVSVKERETGQLSTDVELKTDLTEQQIKDHSIMAILNNAIEMSSKEFKETCILGNLINAIERKSISKDRKSRAEIVAVARNPDTNIHEGNMKQSFMKRLFSPNKPQ